MIQAPPGSRIIMDEINVVKYEDLVETLTRHKEHWKGLNIYAINMYAAGTKIALRAFSSSMRSKELVGLDVVTAPAPEEIVDAEFEEVESCKEQ